jgi:nucleotide-binding universal stress UspA family protein
MKPIKQILAVIDNSKLSRDILMKSIEFADKFDAKIIILYTIHIPFFDLPFYNKNVPIDKEVVKNSINKMFDELNIKKNINYHTIVYFGDSSDRAVVEAKRDNIDIVITGANIKYEKIIREAKKTLLIIKDRYKEYKNILIPTDLSIKSKDAIEFMKENFDANFALVYGYETIATTMSMYDIGYVDMVEYQDENREIAQKLLEEFSMDVGIDGELSDASLSLPYGILDYIEKKAPDLVVTASHSSPKNFLLGSISSYIAKEITTDILIFVRCFT